MQTLTRLLVVTALVALSGCACATHETVNPAATQKPFRVLAVESKAKDHLKMMAAAGPMLTMMGTDNNFTIDITDDATVINDANLAHYDVFLMLQEAPFDMTVTEQEAMQKFVESGHGWVGIHAAGLTGKGFNPNQRYWQWFEDFLGGVVYSPHPRYQQGTLVIEDRNSPITKGLPAKMVISDEWYEFNESPRGRVHVIATADESTYKQNKPMGDHPMIWTNEKYPRTVYIAIGHDASLCVNPDYQVLVRNAILWAAGR
jgi:uncharacterized protein